MYFLVLIPKDSRGKRFNARVSLDPDPAPFWHLNQKIDGESTVQVLSLFLLMNKTSGAESCLRNLYVLILLKVILSSPPPNVYHLVHKNLSFRRPIECNQYLSILMLSFCLLSIPNGCHPFMFNDHKFCVCYISHISGQSVITLAILGEAPNVQRPVVTPYMGVKYLYLICRLNGSVEWLVFLLYIWKILVCSEHRVGCSNQRFRRFSLLLPESFCC